jgi:hypothetical protein
VEAHDPHWVEYVGAVGGLAGVLLAIVAALYAKRSADATERAVSLARDEVNMAKAEHVEFLRQLGAKARFELTLRILQPEPEDDGVIRAVGSVRVLVEIGVKNVGQRAAGETLIQVIAPRNIANFRWSGPKGEQRPDLLAGAALETPEELTDDNGTVHLGQYLDRGLERVTRRTYYVAFFVLDVETPPTGVRSVPVRVTAEADELPDDEPEASARWMIRLARPGGG